MPYHDTPHPAPNEIATIVSNMVSLWQEIARNAAEIAHSRRTLYNAYILEGFTEAQALELVKNSA